jgi:anti-sigma-K factor RskA
MTDPHDLSSDEEDDAFAAEYVLGVLALSERLAAEARLKSDTGFAGRVADWEAHFAALNDDFASAPAPDLMPLIEARIFGKPAPAKRNWWGIFIGAGVAAALAVAVAVNLTPSGGTSPALTASLQAETQSLAFDASYSDGTLTLARVTGADAGPGKDYELWVIVGDAAPVSLGLIKDATSTRPLANLAPGAVLAVSLEKAGGSTTGSPDQVLLTGVVVAL